MIFDPKLSLVGDYSEITVLSIVVVFENDLVIPVRKGWLHHRGSQRRHCLGSQALNGVAAIARNDKRCLPII
jgi:hypothetical protein